MSMSDLSFTQTKRNMQSRPINKPEKSAPPTQSFAKTHNKERKIVRRTQCRDDSYFMSM